jgi:hypothetical protein
MLRNAGFQLGNIELGVLAQLISPTFPEDTIKFAYLGIPGKGADSVNTYWTGHPYKRNFGEFAGGIRADNLAAFGVGLGLGIEIGRLPIMAKSRERIDRNRPILEEGERARFVADARAIVEAKLNDNAFLIRRANKYHGLYEKRTGSSATVTIPPQALFFIPEYNGGFNTDSLDKPRKVPYKGLTSQEYFVTKLRRAYLEYETEKKKSGKTPISLDEWLRRCREDYRSATPTLTLPPP